MRSDYVPHYLAERSRWWRQRVAEGSAPWDDQSVAGHERSAARCHRCGSPSGLKLDPENRDRFICGDENGYWCNFINDIRNGRVDLRRFLAERYEEDDALLLPGSDILVDVAAPAEVLRGELQALPHNHRMSGLGTCPRCNAARLLAALDALEAVP